MYMYVCMYVHTAVYILLLLLMILLMSRPCVRILECLVINAWSSVLAFGVVTTA